MSGTHTALNALPLLPPDKFLFNPDLPSRDPVAPATAEEALSLYSYAQKGHASKKRKRGFVFGSRYCNLFPGYTCIDATGSDFVIELSLPDKSKSTLRVSSAATNEKLLTAIVDLGKTLPKKGNARGNVGDSGEMFALGYRNSNSDEVYSPGKSEKVSIATECVSRLAATEMEDSFPDVLSEIWKAERKKNPNRPPLKSMGGTRGSGNNLMFSRNLSNSYHRDFDGSLSICFWAEDIPGKAGNWFFVIPNASINGKKGLVIKLFHGAIVIWDGNVLGHCSAEADTGDDNNVFACMFGSCGV